MLLRSQATPPSGNTRSRTRKSSSSKHVSRSIRWDVTPTPLRDRSNRPSRTVTRAKGKGKGRDTDAHAMLDIRAAEECVDQAHIVTYPEWQIMDLPQGRECKTNEDTFFQHYDGMSDVQYTEQFAVTLYQLSKADSKWTDLGSGLLTLEASVYASRAIVRMDHTHRVLAHWSIFGGMKVARFLTTVIAVGIVNEKDGSQKVISYGLRVDTLERAKDLAILLSSSSRGMQMNLERLVPKVSAEQRARILETMMDRLIILQRRLGVLNANNELSAQVESELAQMLAMGAELTH